MKKDAMKLIELYSSCPTEQVEYVINGKKFTVVRHFTGVKDINEVISEMAINRADREFGLK